MKHKKMKKIVTILMLIALVIGNKTFAQSEIIRKGLLPKTEISLNWNEYGPLSYIGMGVTYEHFSATAGMIIISKTLQESQANYKGLYIKMEMNIVSMAQKNLNGKIHINPFIGISYGKKEQMLERKINEYKTLLYSGIMLGYELRQVDLYANIQYAGLKVKNESDGKFYYGFTISIYW